MSDIVKSANPNIVKKIAFRLPLVTRVDRVGSQRPAFHLSAIVDQGRVKLGGLGPIFRK